MAEPSPWLTVLVAALATYSWRVLGVMVAGRIDPDGPLFEWVGAVAYALLAGLTVRMIVLPISALQDTDLGCRLIAIAAAVATHRLTRGNVAIGATAGVLVLTILTAAGVRVTS
ncbi:MAG: AzlD domain-containing protein [Rhodospirillaceae bacterium]